MTPSGSIKRFLEARRPVGRAVTVIAVVGIGIVLLRHALRNPGTQLLHAKTTNVFNAGSFVFGVNADGDIAEAHRFSELPETP